ncbi:hypothetical protein [Pelosinus fermentans]|nr:hypothetical protein [Pelosinus fermentans]
MGDSWLMSVKSFLKKLDRLEQYANELSAASARKSHGRTKKGFSKNTHNSNGFITEKKLFK